MGNYWGSAPPPVAKPPEPPRSPSLRSITGVQHPLQWQSHRSLPAHPRFAQLLGFSTPSSGKATRSLPAHPRFAQLLGFSTPSSGKATGASPLTLASLNYWGSAPPPVAKPPEPPRSPSLRSIIGVQHPLQRQSLPEPPRSPSLRSDRSSRPLRSASPVVNRSLSA